MTKKEAIDFCIKMSGKSKMKILFYAITAGVAIGNIYKNSYNAGVYDTGKKDIENTANDNDEILISINGKEV